MLEKVLVPELGDYADVEVIAVAVKVGDTIKPEQELISLETDKATMEIPAPKAGVVKELLVKVGDKVSKGSPILMLEVMDSVANATEDRRSGEDRRTAEERRTGEDRRSGEERRSGLDRRVNNQEWSEEDRRSGLERRSGHDRRSGAERRADMDRRAGLDRRAGEIAYAGPGVRRFARGLGVDLNEVVGTGRKDRITTPDVQDYVSAALKKGGATASGMNVPAAPSIDFSKFGAFEAKEVGRIQKISGAFLHRNWVTIPHVTQFDSADITELEAFRKGQNPLAEQQGLKLTMVVFLMKAVVACLKHFPKFNSSLSPNGEELIMKKYFHIGVAVDTPNGLVVPVIRDVAQKSLFELAADLATVSKKAREGKLSGAEMQGGCFTISSLGGIGGTGFTPIINAPEVAILGVSKAQTQAIYINGQFQPRLMLPLSLSYDHRVIDGAEAARFTSYMLGLLADIRRLLL